MDQSEWECPFCTCLNQSTNRACEACGTPHGGQLFLGAPSAPAAPPARSSSSSSQRHISACPACLTPIQSAYEAYKTPSCRHAMCTDCYGQYITNQMENPRKSPFELTCFESSCSAKIPYEDAVAMASSPDTAKEMERIRSTIPRTKTPTKLSDFGYEYNKEVCIDYALVSCYSLSLPSLSPSLS